MGRRQINPIPEGAEGGACSRCEATKPAESFYYYKDGRRNPWCKDCYRADMKQKAAAGAFKTRPAVVLCLKCEKPYEPRATGPQKYCAPCAKEIIDFKTMLRGALDKADRVAAVWAAPPKTCPHCGVEFRTVQTKAVYCSEKCNSSAHGSRRANGRLPRGSGRRRDIQRAYIIQRDKSTCYLCGKVCSPAEIHLDHVVPLSRGGSHDESNLRVSCAPCNLSKGASARGEQLLLIG